jgi:hypothetical protein
MIKRILLKLVPFTVILLCFSSCTEKNRENDLPIVGLDNTGGEVLRYVPKKRYIKRFSGLMSKIYNKSTERLSRFEFENGWDLKRVSVGLMLVFEVGITSNFKFEFEPSMELRFQPLPKI